MSLSYREQRLTYIATLANGIQGLVLDALETQTPLRIAGRSHWIDAGRPVSATRIASLATHTGIVDYVPGDLTITVRGGTPLRDIDKVVRAEKQWLPLDPFGNADGTIGATIATGSFGPLAHGFGRTRDLVLGVEFVTGDGKVVRGGGRVVKNVAGFDLVRLITGSWGTLGIITEATLRLYSEHGQPRTLAMSVPVNAAGLAQRIDALLTAPLAPFRVELVDAPIAARLGLPPMPVILVELGGNSASVDAQTDTLARMGGMTEHAHGVWEKLRILEDGVWPDSPIVIRLSALPARTAELWMSAARATSNLLGAMIHATPGFGIVRCILPPQTEIEAVRRVAASAPDVTAVYERLPPQMWQSLSPSVVADRLSSRVIEAFDPHRILNPGILGAIS